MFKNNKIQKNSMYGKEGNEEVIEMEQTTFIKRHANKILVAGGLVVTAGAAYLLYKHNVEVKDLLKKHDNEIKDITEIFDAEKTILEMALHDTMKDRDTLMEAASEGVFEEAISKVTNKINHRLDRKEYLEKALEKCPDDIDLKAAHEKVVGELSMLFKRKDKFLEGQAIFEIKNLEE